MGKTFLILLVASACMSVRAQSFRIDTVNVDSVWNSDSAGSVSRDCNLRFVPAGQGTARCTLAVSFDGGTSWIRAQDSATIISPSGFVFTCGQRALVRLRFNGGDRQNVAFKVTGRQLKPAVAASPAAVFVGSPFAVPASGADTTFVVRLAPKALSTRGYAPIQKIYWDFDGDGAYADSTDSLFAPWNCPAYSGSTGQKGLLYVKARDANGLFSAPDTVMVQYGLRRPVAMAAITGGTFTMGNDNGADPEKPAHQVTVSSFSIQATELTAECLALLTGASPLAGHDSALAPARGMSWFSAVLFCNALSKRMGLDTCYVYAGILPNGYIDNTLTCDFSKSGYRLPSEAEWEYACRAGSTTTYFWGDSLDTSYVWAQSNSGGIPQPVATRLPNSFGLYDMSGNVSEWVNDVYVPYTAAAQVDPRGTTYGTYHTQRGGSAPTSSVTGADVSSTVRDNGDHSLGYYYNGFRLARKQ